MQSKTIFGKRACVGSTRHSSFQLKMSYTDESASSNTHQESLDNFEHLVFGEQWNRIRSKRMSWISVCYRYSKYLNVFQTWNEVWVSKYFLRLKIPVKLWKPSKCVPFPGDSNLIFSLKQTDNCQIIRCKRYMICVIQCILYICSMFSM